jgi:ferredoxin-NADP reductase
MSSLRQSARVTAVRILSPTVKELSLEPTRGPLTFVAGQWLNAYVQTDGTLVKRAYSIANAPGSRHVELAVTYVEGGAASPALHALCVGAELEIDGPHGMFTRSPAERLEPSLFVATGTGLAPFRSMLQAELGDPTLAPITLLFGCRTTQDVLWRAELDALTARYPRLSVVVTLSRPEASWTGRTGYVQNHLATLTEQIGLPRVYICGLTRMVSEVRRVLKEDLGYDRKRMQSERYD